MKVIILKQRFIGIAALAVISAYGAAATYAPIEISAIEELQQIGNNAAFPLNGYYILTQDIDASQTANWNNGEGFLPIGKRFDEEDDALAFRGWFDGQGHVIRGLFVNRPDDHGVGLFRSIGSSAVVVNVGLEGGSISGKHYVGALAGANWSEEVVACYASVAVNGISRIGGLAGINRGVIDASYATGTVSGYEFVGGLVGRNYEGIVQECYAAGPVSGVSRVGGLVGQTVEGAVYDSFWDIVVSGRNVSDGGQGLTTDEAMRRDAYRQAGWDLHGLWRVMPGRSYPRFYYQR